MNELLSSILNGDYRTARRLIEEQPELMADRTPHGTSSLELARKAGAAEVEVALVRAGAPGAEAVSNFSALFDSFVRAISSHTCSGWLCEIEFVLWRWVQRAEALPEDLDPWRLTELPDSFRRDLQFLSSRAGGWPAWNPSRAQPEIVPLPQWRREYARWCSAHELAA